jgi:hypothetical protein
VPCQIPVDIVPIVVMLEEPAHVLSFIFSTFPSPTVDALNVAQVGAELPLDFKYYPLVPTSVPANVPIASE